MWKSKSRELFKYGGHSETKQCHGGNTKALVLLIIPSPAVALSATQVFVFGCWLGESLHWLSTIITGRTRPEDLTPSDCRLAVKRYPRGSSKVAQAVQFPSDPFKDYQNKN